MQSKHDLAPKSHDRGSWISGYNESNGLSGLSEFAGSPWQTIRRFQEDMDRFFNQTVFQQPAWSFGVPSMSKWAPATDISENDKELSLEMELPGVNIEDIDLQVIDHQLVVRAQMRDAADNSKQSRKYHVQERRYGYVQEVVPIPSYVNEDDIRAEFNNGILICHLAKSAQAKPQGKQIRIASGRSLTQSAGLARDLDPQLDENRLSGTVNSGQESVGKSR